MAIAGYNTIGGATDFNSTDDGYVIGPFTVGVGSTITEYHLYAEPGVGTGSFRPIIYEDSGGEPGNMVATLVEQVVTSGNPPEWYDVTGLSIVSPSAAIWIGLWTEDNFVLYHYDTPGGTPGRYTGTLAAYSASGDAPSWPAGSDSTSTQEVSCYVVYTAAAASQTLRPDADTTTTGWTTTPLWSKLDEDPAGGDVVTATAS